MKPTSRLLLLFAGLALTFAAVTASAQTDAQKAFNAIKNMPGTWEQQTPDGHTLTVTFKVVSGGSAVMSEIMDPHEDMISMIHLDGPNRLLLTHYCAVGNQPRMAASFSPDGKVITFHYVDGTNMATPDAAHMKQMVLTLINDNHHTEQWSFAGQGKDHTALFDLHRKM